MKKGSNPWEIGGIVLGSSSNLQFKVNKPGLISFIIKISIIIIRIDNEILHLSYLSMPMSRKQKIRKS